MNFFNKPDILRNILNFQAEIYPIKVVFKEPKNEITITIILIIWEINFKLKIPF